MINYLVFPSLQNNQNIHALITAMNRDSAKEDSVSVPLEPDSGRGQGRMVMVRLSAPTADGNEGNDARLIHQTSEQIECEEESTLVMMTSKEKDAKDNVIIRAMTKQELSAMINSLVQLCYYYIFAPSF